MVAEGVCVIGGSGIDTCSVCGGDLIGEGYTSVVHCENVEVSDDVECDAEVVGCWRERVAKLQHMQIEDRVAEQNITLTIGFSNHHFQQCTFRKGDSPALVATMLQEMSRQVLDNDNLRG